jgi:hypothetical protein
MAYKTPAPLTTQQFNVLVGGASNTIGNVIPGAAGQIFQSNGAANPSFSTATYPSTATGTGKILRADGTNWVASTATYPDTAGTSGNVLTSDGTNWSSSAAPASGLGYVLTIINDTTSGPASGATYFFVNKSFTTTTASGTAMSRMTVPFAGTVTKVYGAVTVAGTLGSTENGTLSLRLNDTTDTTISSTLKLNTTSNAFNATVSIAVVAGDFLEFKFVSPTWVTSPTTVSVSGSVYIS